MTSFAQINSYPYTQTFEDTFITGDSINFLPSWWGNTVGTSNRIFRAANEGREGSAALAAQTIGTFNANIQISTDLSSLVIPRVTFWAKTNQNGTATSTRGVIVTASIWVDGVEVSNQLIGDATVFPNANTPYSQYEINLPPEAMGSPDVMISLLIEYGDGTGSAARFFMDDFTIDDAFEPLAITKIQVLSENSLAVVFNKAITETSASNPANYTFTDGVSCDLATWFVDRPDSVILQTSGFAFQTYDLSISDIEAQDGEILTSMLNGSFELQELLIENVEQVDKTTIEITFNQEIDPISGSDNTNYQVDEVGNPNSVTVSGNQATLTFLQEFDSYVNYTLIVSNIENFGGYTQLTSVNNFELFYVDPLAVVSAQTLSHTEVSVTFDQALEESTATNLTHFFINQTIGNPSAISWSTDTPNRVILQLAKPLRNNDYQLTINAVSGVYENPIPTDTSIDFSFVQNVSSQDLMISEFLPDPNPKGLIPPNPVLPTAANDEFVELYNHSEQNINIGGFLLNGREIEDFLMPAKSYVIIVAESKREVFEVFGAVAVVPTFAALTNTAGTITLDTDVGERLESITYDTSWYQDAEKSNGGWSIERINPTLICSTVTNWRASEAAEGATPGQINSVFDDSPNLTAPTISSVLADTDQGLKITFSEPMDLNSLQAASYQVASQAAQLDSVSQTIIILQLTQNMLDGEHYLIEITGATDCQGNVLTETFDFLYDTSPPQLIDIRYLENNRLLLSFDEVLLSSSATNRLNYRVNAEAAAEAEISSPQTISLQLANLLVLDSAYTLSINGLSDLQNNVIFDTLRREFLYESAIDSVWVTTSNQLTVRFKEATSARSEQNSQYSLGSQSPIAVSNVGSNYDQYLLTFEQSFSQNSNLLLRVDSTFSQSQILLQTPAYPFSYDTRAPSINAVTAIDAETIEVIFSEPVNAERAEAVNNYTINNGIGNPIQAIQKADKSVVNLQLSTPLTPEVTYRLGVINVSDLSGNIMERTINTDFVYDQQAPFLQDLRYLSPFSLELIFSEPIDSLSSLESNFRLMESIFPKSTLHATTQDVLTLTYEEMIPEGEAIKLEIFYLSDLKGNVNSDTIIVSLDTQQLRIGSITPLSDRELLVGYSKNINPIDATILSKFNNNEATAESADLVNPHTILLTFSEAFDSISNTLQIQEIRAAGSEELYSFTQPFIYQSAIQSVTVENGRTLNITFREALADARTTLTGRLQVEEFPEPISIVYPTNQQNIVQISFDQAFTEGLTYTLRSDTLRTQNGALLPRGFAFFTYDLSPPILDAITFPADNQLLLHFNEALDRNAALATNHYLLDDLLNPQQVILSAENEVLLTFAEALTDGNTHTLTVTRVADLVGNRIVSQVFTFNFEAPYIAKYKDIVINELMAAPRPERNLPNTEYVELYNTSSQTIKLGGYRLANASTSTLLPAFDLAPDAYVILAPNSGANALRNYGDVLGLSSWPTLRNNEDEVYLYNLQNDLIDSVYYNQSTYQSTPKAGSGYSLELINPFTRCGDQSNWIASTDSNGGTPGKINSVFDDTPDLTGPRLEAVEVISPTQLLVIYNEKMSQSASSFANYQFSPSISVQSIQATDQRAQEFVIFLSEPLLVNENYTLTVNALADCSGNLIQDSFRQQSFILPDQAELGDILLSEVLFNAGPGGVKFVELYNTSDKFINLQNWQLANLAGEEIGNLRNISQNSLIIAPGQYLAITTDATILKSRYPKGEEENFITIPSLPSYPIGGGSVILLDPQGEQQQRLDYAADMHSPLLQDVRGVSLERISFTSDENDPQIWKSAGSSENFATPGYANSQARPENSLEALLSIEPKVFAPDDPGTQNFTSINYNFTNTGNIGSVSVYSPSGALVKTIARNELMSLRGFFTWDGTDDSGRKAKAGYYIVYVEVFNPSDGSTRQIKKTVVVASRLR
ncbi:lamin tail domain-containing protein [Penaeicola halotolerans]|uniref:lamin tail domain-containing protein n=1 Tax=Penaeicola halotolerans TaxID=2793196 RepID=UPI001CF84A5B|nr:lamin tail domain-containing protein [Penaeicola halotolerans]